MATIDDILNNVVFTLQTKGCYNIMTRIGCAGLVVFTLQTKGCYNSLQ